ncbi:cytochrome b/b6 domain-containing protein [Piscinibacter terrae]|uniref:Cytochrome B oxidoreductase n=1 Tax=Piscinibacter terrae TaxID=2496871 RepID=A0A3N7HSE8_9BURK|nr:cytochrome b/b6 domain-containing protein [Albitalea terrae]RQP25200.1 cytochrome B oxidoreductase [Albitalea terrae]
MSAERSDRDDHVPVWDAAVRVGHWLLAGLVVFNLIAEDGGWWHRALGYIAAGVVVLRLTWALFASGGGGIAALKPSLRETLAYLRARAPRRIDHDPLGVWMVWLLWLLVLLLGLTGWMSRWDMFWGDDRVLIAHAWLADALMVAVLLHLLGVLVMSIVWRENLPGAMVTGRKRRPD